MSFKEVEVCVISRSARDFGPNRARRTRNIFYCTLSRSIAWACWAGDFPGHLALKLSPVSASFFEFILSALTFLALHVFIR